MIAAGGPIRIAINGYGRIGRCVLRALHESGHRDQIKLVAINEPADLATIGHLTRYDSTHGRFPGAVAVEGNCLHINRDTIAVSHIEALDELPWHDQGIDVVLECSGLYRHLAELEQHLQQGAGKVLLSQPGEHELKAVVWGLNQTTLSGEDRVVSAASCTSNAVLPVIAVLHRAFNIDSGIITTIHSAMNDQPVLDAYHHTDLRKTRASSQSIIPVDTSLAAGVGRVMPGLEGRFSARALRVPTLNVSAIELSVVAGAEATVESVNNALRQAAQDDLMDILGYSEEPLASCDFNHDARSGIVDAGQTRVCGRQISVLIWFDNEWAYANRMLDIVSYWHGQNQIPEKRS